MKFLAICYNETACLSDPANVADFWRRVSGNADAATDFPLQKGIHVDEAERVATMPGPCVPLHKLDPDHHARAYLEERGFDPDRVGRVYGASFCLDSHYYLAARRIIVPIKDRGELRGWQARYVGERDWKAGDDGLVLPKYFSMPGMPRRLLLYNLDRARQYPTGVIVEGVTDVWKFGPMAVASLGATMSGVQIEKFFAAFRRRGTAVLLYDPEAMETPGARKVIDALEMSMSQRYVAVKLPAGTDPGELDREFLRDYVAEEAERQKVKVSWKKRGVSA